jgi:transcriptional regulator with XRE-family HTH domain
MDKRQEIARNISLMVKASAKTQQQIAIELGVDQTMISKYILGKAVPSATLITKLCQVLDCSYEDILGRL